MIIVKTSEKLTTLLSRLRQPSRKIGFVPTMGALHAGHLSLLEASKKENDLSVCSIFVNPTQFNNPDDFKHYPSSIEADIDMLEAAGCQVLFLPNANDIYPPGYQEKSFDLGYLETILEGAHRPGHFKGVCQVVDILLDLVKPDHLYLGQKDFQQCMVIKRLLQLTGKQDAVVLKIMPTIRENDGLAMSSRNRRLDAEARRKATAIFRIMSDIGQQIGKTTLDKLEREAQTKLEAEGFVVDYVSIRNAEDLSEISTNGKPVVVLAAATLGPVRLIDNLIV
jgi:pantoate--beta-alanine ligase